MFSLSTQIPQTWVYGVCLLWTIGFLYLCIRKDFFAYKASSEAFPFGIRQFFLMALSLACIIGLYLASFLLSTQVVVMLKQSSFMDFQRQLSHQQEIALSQIIGLVMSSLGLFFFNSLIPEDLKKLVLGGSNGWKKFLKGAFFGIAIYPVIILLMNFIGTVVEYFHIAQRAPQVAFLLLDSVKDASVFMSLLIFVIVACAPFVEEMVFRGYMQGFFLGIIHPVFAVIVTAAFFASLHYSSSQQGSNVEIMAALVVFSLFSSALRMKEDSLASSIGMHAAFNATSVGMYFLQQYV